MTTSMHRLQISLPGSQVKYLTDRAKREGISIAELLRRLIHRELEQPASRGTASIRAIIGIGRNSESLINGIPVSEQPDLYLHESAAAYKKAAIPKTKGARKTR